MFSKKANKALIFIFKKERRISLHSFFVFYPIDILFLDSKKKVVEIKENFLPFNIYIPKKKSKFIIELPAGTIKKSGTKIRDTITF